MTATKFSGVYAALLTPRGADDNVDREALTRLVQFLCARGIDSFALNGATGEFCIARPQHLKGMIETAREASDGKGQILCGIGGTSVGAVRELAMIAEEEGAAGLLLPMPYFFRYEQQDLEAFCRAVAKSTGLPILLYNLPQFSSGLEKQTVRALIEELPNIIGIKDSGGSLEILRHLTSNKVEACRIVGNDLTLRSALSEGLCDGAISGIACVLPELILELYARGKQAAWSEFEGGWGNLRDLAEQIESLPTPWALKWIAEARGIFQATFAQPMSKERAARGLELQAWFRSWFSSAVPSGRIAL